MRRGRDFKATKNEKKDLKKGKINKFEECKLDLEENFEFLRYNFNMT